jgi:hypothetical protein
MDEKIEIHPDIVLLDTQKNINWQIWNRLSVWSFSRGSINLANAAKCYAIKRRGYVIRRMFVPLMYCVMNWYYGSGKHYFCWHINKIINEVEVPKILDFVEGFGF